MKIRKFLSTLLACMLLGSLLPSAEAIDCAIYDAYAPPSAVTAHRASDAGPRSFMTADADEAAEGAVSFHPYVFTVGEDASVTASVQLQPTLMLLSARAPLLTKDRPYGLDGEGTLELPFWIGTAEQLAQFRDIVNGINCEKMPEACAILTGDIDLGNIAWTPINDYAGSFEGCGHVISGLRVSGAQYAGLFGVVNGGRVCQLGVEGSVSAATQSDDAYAGGVAAYSASGHIAECWFNGTVRADSASGSAYAGGVVGSFSYADLSDCYSLGAVSAESTSGSAYAGGVMGYFEGEAFACYHKDGAVTAAGGDGHAFAGGVAGSTGVDNLPMQCYYLTGTAPGGVNSADIPGTAEPLTAEQFAQTESFFVKDSDTKRWDFPFIWHMNETEGRPMLKRGLSIDLEVSDISLGETMYLNITLSAADASGSIMLIARNGDNITEFPSLELSEGKATQNIEAPRSGTYNLTVEYSGDDRYLPCVTTASFRVTAPFYEVSSWDEISEFIGASESLFILQNNITDMNQTAHIVIPDTANITVDLKGFCMDRGNATPVEDGGIFYVRGNLSIIDSAGGGAITGGNTTGSGGAIYVADGGNLTLRNVSFTNNTAQYFGGAIFLNNTANITVENVTFSNNFAGTGGAIYAGSETDLKINNCTFTDNKANGADGASAISTSDKDTFINRSSFINNTGGAFVVGSNSEGNCECDISNCAFIGNNCIWSGIGFATRGNQIINNNWFGNTADNYEQKPNTFNVSANAWFFMNLTRTIDSATGQYAFNAALGRYNSTSLNLTQMIAPKDYPLPVIRLDGGVQGADIDAAEASAGGIHLPTQGGENNASGAVLVLSPEGYSSVNFTPSVNSTNYTLSFRYPGHPEIYQNLTFVRTIRVNENNDTDMFTFNDTESGPIAVMNLTALENEPGSVAVVNLTALENDKEIPNIVLANKTATVEVGDQTFNYTITSSGVFEMDLGNVTPGEHDAFLTVPGFVPLAVNLTAPRWQTPLNVTAPEYVVIGEDVTIDVSVPANATGNVTLNIRDGAGYDETHYTNITDGKGRVVPPPLPVGFYTVNATYSGDDNYLKNATSVSFRVVEKSYTVALSASPTGGGSVTGAGNYTGGTDVTVTAAPNPGYDFVSWKEGDTVVSENATYVFPATANRNLTAVFARKTFAVSFVNDDGTALQNCTVAYGDTAAYTGDPPTKAATAQYTFSFAGWNPEPAAVTANTTYTATYSNTTNTYMIRFVDDDGTSLQNCTVAYGETPEYPGADPTKNATGATTYTFAGWTPEITAVTGNATYTATYSNATNKYPVRFLDDDGYVLAEDTVAYGETPKYTGETPTKAATAEKTYTFLRWEPALTPVTGAQTYYAVFSDTDVSYTIRFLNEGGAELQRAEYKYGETPEYTGAAPTKNATAQYTYAFAGWTPEIKAVTGDQDYTATFNESLNKYTVRFVNYNGTELQATEYAYGETPAYTGLTPTKAEDAQYTYAFDGWMPALAAVTGNATYTASFKATEKQGPTPTPTPTYDYVALPAETRFDVVDPRKGGSLDNFKRSRTYVNGTFSDVDPEAWYFENVVAAFEYALMEGMGDGTFGVGARLKLSEALALACRLHNIYYGGSGKFDQTKDANWYTVYEDYAVKYGIIQKGEYDLTKDATRAQFAAILSAALPDAALKPINDVKTLPDMKAGDPRLPAILRLYNAGILTGVDEQGNFRPDAFIPREQIAAMATRIADPSLRKAVTLA